MNRYISLVRLCMLSVLIVTLASCTKAPEPSAAIGFCAVGSIPNAHCQHKIADQTMTLYSSSPSMPEETAIDLYVDLPNEWLIQRSHLSGESMYMGTIPVVWEALENGRWLAKIRLGACTDPQMIWRLSLRIDTEAGQTTTEVSFPVAAHP